MRGVAEKAHYVHMKVQAGFAAGEAEAPVGSDAGAHDAAAREPGARPWRRPLGSQPHPSGAGESYTIRAKPQKRSQARSRPRRPPRPPPCSTMVKKSLPLHTVDPVPRTAAGLKSDVNIKLESFTFCRGARQGLSVCH
jgi:hypothetical protein